MTTFQDLMHDLGGEYTKLLMGSVVIKEDMDFLVQDGHIKASESELKETVSYARNVLLRVKQYMVSAFGFLTLVKPLIDEKVGPNNALFTLKAKNDEISRLAEETIKSLTDLPSIEIVKTASENIQKIIALSKEAEKIFFTVKPALYEKIGQKTEVAFGNGFKVLILDDQKDICDYLSNFLKKKGFRVEIATTANEAIGLAKSMIPQIALLDIKLDNPSTTGIDVLKHIRIYQPGCRCFMITLVDDKEILKKCLDLGAIGALTKPFNVDEIKNSLFKIVMEILNAAE